jgi:hypothetical protein
MSPTRRTKKHNAALYIDKKKKEVIYSVSKESGQYKHIKEIKFEGFIELPKGFYKEGFGLVSPAGTFLLSALASELGSIRLIVTKDGESKIRKLRSVFHVTIKHSDYVKVLEALREIGAERNQKSRDLVRQELAKLYSDEFSYDKDGVETLYAYAEDKIAKILHGEENIVEKLSKNDITAITEAYGELARTDKLGLGKKDLKIIAKSKSATEKVYLEKVVKEFEQKLGKATQTESEWQTFLHDYILLFNTSYMEVLEKMSVSLGGKYPDFMLLNVYNYIDIYEIKKPSTGLLRRDASRNNYYWDVEICKAIIQIENYIHLLNKNSATFREEVGRSHGVDIKVVRPRGFIIAGVSDQLTDEKMRDDFRLLSSSLKNIDIVPYDDLLNNLKNLLNRL